MTECPNAKSWGRPWCRFEARYDEQPAINIKSLDINAYWGEEKIRTVLYYRTYVRDVCTRCGRTIEREKVK